MGRICIFIYITKGKIGDNEYFKRYRDQVSKISPNELTDQYFDSLPNEQRCKIEMQRMMIAKTKQMDKIKRETTDKEERKKNDDYEICDKLY